MKKLLTPRTGYAFVGFSTKFLRTFLFNLLLLTLTSVNKIILFDNLTVKTNNLCYLLWTIYLMSLQVWLVSKK